jgi:hypothetical protein
MYRQFGRRAIIGVLGAFVPFALAFTQEAKEAQRPAAAKAPEKEKDVAKAGAFGATAKYQVINKQVEKPAAAKAGAPAQKQAAQPKAAVIMRLNRNAENMTQQMIGQLRPVVRVEYDFLLMVCKPGEDARKAIAREAARALKTAATKTAEWQFQPNGRAPDGRKAIQDALAAAARAHLAGEQAANYATEIAAPAACDP